MKKPEQETKQKPDAIASRCRQALVRNTAIEHLRREHFIPLRKTDLILRLTESAAIPARDKEQFRSFCRLLDATFHFQFHECFEQLKDAYAPFNPDAVTAPDKDSTTDDHGELMEQLFDRFGGLLQQANYEHLDREAIEEALEATSDWGVQINVDLDAFERLDVYIRGDVMDKRERRRPRKLLRTEVVDVPMYERLVVIFRLNRPPRLALHVLPEAVYIKLFKNIPKQDIDMLLPASSVRMTWLDRGRIMLPTVSGVSLSVYKIVTTGLLLAYTSFVGMVAFLGTVGGTLGYGVKSFFGYLRTKDKYQYHLTRSLYYQNLDNNAGVLSRILDEAEEQEVREALLAYFLLSFEASDTGWTSDQLDRRAEQMIGAWIKIDVDFEVSDALRKLKELELARPAADGRWTAVPLADALVVLDRAWDAFFHYA